MQDPDQRGLVAVHGLGSGKTLTSIAVADALKLPADVVVPAALQGNYQKEVAKHTDKPFPMNLQSLELTARKGGGSLQNPLLIVDEAHRVRNPGKTQSALMKSPASKRLLLTGSLMYNHPGDMAAPINLVAGSGTLPSKQNEFENQFIQERRISPGLWGELVGKPGQTKLEINPLMKPYLEKVLHKYVDYHPGSTENFPQTQEQTLKVPMSGRQRKIYDAVMDAAPPWVKDKILRNLPPTKSEAKELNAFLTGIRQVSNSTAAYDLKNPAESPKIDRAVAELKQMLEANPRAKAIVYSNFLPSGINPYKAKLDELKVPYGEFTGEMPRLKRDQLVRDYNEGKLRALLLSSAGGEGLDLKGTRLIQLLEPHWNEEKLKQVQGRGIRFKSHDDLPPEERNVLIQRFLATRPRAGFWEKLRLKDPGTSVDEYLHDMGARKEELKGQFKALLAQSEKEKTHAA
jgi:SNF2 family DNA or RNA helicase